MKPNEEQIGRLLELLSPRLDHPATDKAMMAAERIYTLKQGPAGTGEDKRDVFLGLCDDALDAYGDSDSDRSDEAIRAHPLTPNLIRYVLESMDRFNSATEDGKWGDAQFAKAFLASNPRGNPGKLVLRRDPMLKAAASATVAARASGADPETVSARAKQAAYEAYREGETGDQDSRELKKTMAHIAKLLKHEMNL